VPRVVGREGKCEAPPHDTNPNPNLNPNSNPNSNPKPASATMYGVN